jgi:hypothetical protein
MALETLMPLCHEMALSFVPKWQSFTPNGFEILYMYLIMMLSPFLPLPRNSVRRILMFVSVASLSLPATESVHSLRAARTPEAIRIDGHLDEAAWSLAPALKNFTQLTPMLGLPSKKRTEVRVLFDDRYLYIGARMHHEPGSPVVRQVHRRDQTSASDWFAIFIDSAHDHRSAYSFMVNASGVQRDGVHFEDGTEDWSWDGVWESAVTVDDEGWTAELKIPISLLRFHNDIKSLTWGVNFARRDEGNDREASYWFVPPRGENVWVSRFNHLEGLENLKPSPRRELIPYVSTQRKFETAQPYDDRKWTVRGGLDAHLGINSHSQLDFTLRPDFGQVEVDQAVMNLTTVETFFPEKRPFFLEGMDIFQVPGARLFYSRRIGKGLDGPHPGLNIVDWPKAAEIAAAAKYTAKFSGGLAVGVLGAGLETGRATLRDESGRAYKQELSPYTSTAVMRVTQAMDDRGSYLGAFGSFLREANPAGRNAGVGALDGTWKSQDRSTSFDSVFSHSEAGMRTVPKAGDYFRAHILSSWGQGWSIDTNAFTVSRNYNPNDLGYLDRPDRKGVAMDLDHRWDFEKGIFRNPMLRFTYTEFQDQTGKPYIKYAESWGKLEFTNNWGVYMGGGVVAEVYDDRELRTFQDPVKKYLRVAGSHYALLVLESPPNQPWAGAINWKHAWLPKGPKTEISLTQSIKPTPRLELSLETAYTHANGEPAWIETQGTTPIVGTRKLSELDQVVRVAYAFSPTLTVQVFSQWLAANWAFSDLRRYVNDQTLAPGASARESPLANSARIWNLNIITRWEFRPGSSLFIVYTHGAFTGDLINDRASLSPRGDLAIMGHLPSDDVVQVKFSWLFR